MAHGKYDDFDFQADVAAAMHEREERKGMRGEFPPDDEDSSPEGDGADPNTGSTGAPSPYRVLSLTEALTLPPVTWRVEGLLPERGKFCLAGPPGSGKGLVTIALLLSIATGVPLRGNIPVKQGPVVYLAAEGFPGVPQRCQAWLAAHGLTAETGGPDGTP